MRLDSRYLTYRWLRKNVRLVLGKDEEESSFQKRVRDVKDVQKAFKDFIDQVYQGGRARVPNPHPDIDVRHDHPEVAFSTAWKYPEFRAKVHREFERWRGQSEDQRTQSQHPTQGMSREQGLEMAQDGKVVAKEKLGHGDTMNETYEVRLQLGDQEADYVFKPWEGARERLIQERGVSSARLGIPQEEQHYREAATYQLDQALFGDDGIVPPTAARDDGSYQQMARGARNLAAAFDEVIQAVPADQLINNPSFQRLNVLDLISGNQDRHANNVMFWWDGDEKNADSLRLVAIDNGLSFANPDAAAETEDYYYVSPFKQYMQLDTDEPSGEWEDVGAPEDRTKPAEDKTVPTGGGKMPVVDGIQAQRRMMADIPKDIHEQLKQVDLGQFVSSIADSGVEESAAKAAAVRLAALQADPTIFGTFLEMTDNSYKDAWEEFQVFAGTMPEKLLKTAGAPEKLKEITDALKARKGPQDVI